LLIAALAACGPASVDGKVGGRSLDASDAVVKRSAALGVSAAEVWIGGATGDLCADLSAGVRRKAASYLWISFGMVGTLAPGTFTVGIATSNDRYALAAVRELDTACNAILEKGADSGSVTVESADEQGVSGRFGLVFDADSITGSFSARACGWSSAEDKTCE